jgi:glycerol-3-phosphate dehydrogenase
MTPPAASPGAIRRDPERAARSRYDLIVVGGGVYGIMIALEATRRRLRPLVLERADLAGATSHNSLRILHGGLRYLQSLDLGRSLEAIRERAWWRAHFPDLVQPLPCLMPLYGNGLRRPAALRPGLLLNDLLGRWQAPAAPFQGGRLIDAATVRKLCPAIEASGLLAGAIWHDAVATCAPRLMIEALRWACAHGAGALNYLEATGVLADGGRVAGVTGRDQETGATHAFRATTVINAAGPWADAFAALAGADAPRLFRPVLAWNAVFRRPPPADHALAIQARRRGAQTYFLVPLRHMLVAGTGYAPWRGEAVGLRLAEPLLERFVAELNEAMPRLALTSGDVVRTYVGLLPARTAGTTELTDRALIVDHGRAGSPAGLFSVSGVKLTTARALAERVIERAFPAAKPLAQHAFVRPPALALPSEHLLLDHPAADPRPWRHALRQAVRDEAALHLDDLLLRRTGLGDDPQRVLAVAPVACRLLGWDRERALAERARLEAALEPFRPPRLATLVVQ